jgi:hypothetical protein
MKICYGTTRIVFLIGKIAIKIPSITEYRLFLHGLLANMQEVTFSKTKWIELCPILFHIPFGFLVVMKRATPLTREQFETFNIDEFRENPDHLLTFVEAKMDSFGIVDGRIVAVDYGS